MEQYFPYLPSYYYDDISGTSELTLKRSVGEPLRGLKLYGNSVQDGMPTPDTPIEVVSVGDLTENLFDNKRSWDGAGSTAISSYGGSNVTKLAGGGYYLKPYSSVLFRFTNLTDGEKYTISWDITTEMSGQNTNPIQINGSILKHNYVYNKETKRLTQSFTATATTTIAFGFVNTSNAAYSASITNIMLVKGESAKDYEPYGYRIPIKASGKNLFDETKSQDGWLGQDGMINDSEATKTTDFIKVRSGETLMLSYKYDILASTNNRSYLFYDENKNPISSSNTYYVPQNQQAKIESSQNGYVRVCYDSNAYDIQIEHGNVVTEFEPYIEPVITNIYLSEPIRKLTNYVNVEFCDELNFETGRVIRRVREVVNTTNFFKYSHYGSICAFVVSPTQYFTKYGHIQSAPKCNICLWNTNPSGYISESQPICMYMANDTSAGVYYVVFWVHTSLIGVASSDTDAVKLQAFKKWMAERNVRITCPCNPYEEDVDLSSLPTFKGTTIYEIETSVQISNIELQYYRY